MTGMALAHCILGKYLGVVCHCFPPPLDVPTLASKCLCGGPGSAVGIATGYGLEVGRSNPGGGETFRTSPDRPWAPPSLLCNGSGSSPGVKSDRGVTLTPHHLLVPWSRKSRAIPLLPLWAVWPVQSLSACTRVHFTLLLTSHSMNLRISVKVYEYRTDS